MTFRQFGNQQLACMCIPLHAWYTKELPKDMHSCPSSSGWIWTCFRTAAVGSSLLDFCNQIGVSQADLATFCQHSHHLVGCHIGHERRQQGKQNTHNSTTHHTISSRASRGRKFQNWNAYKPLEQSKGCAYRWQASLLASQQQAFGLSIWRHAFWVLSLFSFHLISLHRSFSWNCSLHPTVTAVCVIPSHLNSSHLMSSQFFTSSHLIPCHVLSPFSALLSWSQLFSSLLMSPWAFLTSSHLVSAYPSFSQIFTVLFNSSQLSAAHVSSSYVFSSLLTSSELFSHLLSRSQLLSACLTSSQLFSAHSQIISALL